MDFIGGLLGVLVTLALAWALARPADRAFRGVAGVAVAGLGVLAAVFVLSAVWPKTHENLDLPDGAVLQIVGLAAGAVAVLTLPRRLIVPRREAWWLSAGRAVLLVLSVYLVALAVLALGAGEVIDTDGYARAALFTLLPAQCLAAFTERRRLERGPG